jgi:hypothetical protein
MLPPQSKKSARDTVRVALAVDEFAMDTRVEIQGVPEVFSMGAPGDHSEFPAQPQIPHE